MHIKRIEGSVEACCSWIDFTRGNRGKFVRLERFTASNVLGDPGDNRAPTGVMRYPRCYIELKILFNRQIFQRMVLQFSRMFPLGTCSRETHWSRFRQTGVHGLCTDLSNTSVAMMSCSAYSWPSPEAVCHSPSSGSYVKRPRHKALAHLIVASRQYCISNWRTTVQEWNVNGETLDLSVTCLQFLYPAMVILAVRDGLICFNSYILLRMFFIHSLTRDTRSTCVGAGVPFSWPPRSTTRNALQDMYVHRELVGGRCEERGRRALPYGPGTDQCRDRLLLGLGR